VEDYVADEFADGSAFYRFSAFLGLAAAAVLAAAVVTYNTVGTFSKEVLALLIVAVVLGILYVIPRLDELGNWMRSRSARQGSNVTLASVGVIGLLIVGNWYANRHSPQWDLTAAKRYTLSDQTVKILNKLDKDVTVIAFFPSQQQDSFTRGTKDLLQLYARRSPHIKLQFVDPEVNPGAAQQYNITSYPVTIFQQGDRKEQTTGLTEQDFTSTLLKLSQTEQKKVYFLQGHQERDIGSTAQNGYSAAVDGLKKENYVVDTLSLITTGKVPDDAAVVIIAGPRAPLLDPEKQALDDYLNNRGGHVLLLTEPRQDVGLQPLLDKWYVQLDNDIVVDPGRNYIGDPLSPAPIPQTGHRISTSLPDVLMPGARSVTIKPGAGSDFAIAPLLKTTDRAWGETDFSSAAKFDQGVDVAGPLTLAVAVNQTDPTQGINPAATPTPATQSTPSKPKGRLVVVGDTEFASNTYFSQVLGNHDFLINSVDWLAEDEDLISIRATPQNNPPVVLTNQSQVMVFYTSVVFIPAAVLLAGAVVWWQRR
jgi:ABC-type uncharacterized transport system involved in gliding motility auxiliary subunit